MYKKIECMVGCFSVSVLLKGVVDSFAWICTGLYGSNVDGLRDALCTELDSVRGRWSAAWCLFGDFNITRYPAERLGCSSFSPAMLNSRTLLRGIYWLIYLWWGVSIHGSVTQRTLLCLELIECWYSLIGRIIFWM